jgi:large repetitive protein
MNTKSVIVLIRSALAASTVLLAGAAGAATTTVNLTAQRTTIPLDGATVPMWGYCGALAANADATPSAGTAATVTCGSGAWTVGPTITVPAGSDLVVNLTNSLPMPTSLVVLGQRGGGLGAPTKMAGPAHAGQTQTTWPGNGAAAFTPPAQPQRAMSFATQVGAATTTSLTWTSLKAGTYIYETGTLPSVQAPMGLYGVLIVTAAPDTSGSTAVAQAYPGIKYDADVALLFSEIDPVQNLAVDSAAVAGTDVNKRFDDPACNALPNETTPRCYPAAVNYTPKYFLINGKSFDQAAPSTFAPAGNSYASGKVLVRLLNAGSRTHIPSIVGLPMSIVAEDGNVAPGNPKLQNEVLLVAGKTHDVLVSPPASASDATVYGSAAFAVFDRQLSLSAANQVNAGMQGYLTVNGGALPTVAAAAPRMTPTAVDDSFAVPPNSTIGGNVRTNDVAVLNAAVVTLPANGALSFYSDGTFAYTTTAASGTETFTYRGNDGTTNVATVTLHIGGAAGNSVTALDQAFTSKLAGSIAVSRPGVLEGASDPDHLALTAELGGTGSCGTVVLKADGSFTATGSGSSCQFTYKAVNPLNAGSAAHTVTVNFPTGSGLVVNVHDETNAPITDYRWIIQEDLTFKEDPTGTPAVATRSLGTSFHRSYMNLVASGCTGAGSCSADVGQTIRGAAVTPRAATSPGAVYLDPAKHYYISILPNDAGDGGHAMGGAEIKPGQLAVDVNSNTYPWVPSQLSVFIYEDNSPVNGQNDGAEVNQGLGGFNIILMDAVGRSGDVAGQQTFDSYGMPLSNWLLGRPGCPDDLNKVTNGTGVNTTGNVVGVVYTCPNDPNAGTAQADPAKYALAGHALIRNLTPARYDVIAHPAAERQGRGEVWWQTETLEGTPAQDAFNGVKEPVYFQEFGPPGFHTTIGLVNPDHVKKYAADNGLTGTHAVTGRITNQHMSRPSDTQLWDSGSYDMLSSTTCQVALNSLGGTGPAIAITQCDPDGSGNFTLSGVPPGDYELVVWDQWLDQIIQAVAVTVPADVATVAMGNIPVLSWFTEYDQNIFLDANKNGVYDKGESGISNVVMTTRYRDGGISNQTATDSNGNGLLAELFPLFNWYVTEADTTRFKQTGVNIIVDAGGPTDLSGDGAGLWNSTYKATPAHPAACADGDTTCTSVRTEVPGAYSYGLQGFISERSTINWGRTPYVAGENGGIAGYVVNSTTRPFDDQRYNVQTLWEPLVPRVKVNLYRREVVGGVEHLTLVDTTYTSSWDDFVNAVDPVTGKQVNMQCPGQLPGPPASGAGSQPPFDLKTVDPFTTYTLGSNDQFRCYDGWHNWNQIQAAPYDGRYQFPSAAYIAQHAGGIPSGGTLVSLPPGEYVVEAVTPDGFEVVKEEDKNILNGDTFSDPAVTQFAGIGNVFILPDQATLNNANPYNLKTADGIANNATTNLGVTGSLVNQPECVGSLHRVPDYLSLFPGGGLVAPFAGMDRPLCDRKLVRLNDQMQATAAFFVFTEVPLAANGTGIILDDATSEFNQAAPDFGEKASVPFVPVSIKDFNGREISRTYSDQWGAYNTMTPSSWLVNPPTPSGYGPNMLVTCMNDPGPIAEIVNGTPSGRMITDPQYNPAYSNFCYTLPFMPGRTTYLDTPVLPIAAFAAGYNPADCAYPDATPAIARVDSSAGFGPYVPASGTRTLTITALGFDAAGNDVGVDVPNPAYAGPFALTGPTSLRTLKRHYGFGTQDAGSRVTVNGVAQTITSWTPGKIAVTVASTTTTGELVVTTAGGKSTIDAVTVTVGGTAPKRVQGALGQTIQGAIDAATPGDLILVDAGTYNELVIMWKPVRLQGVGAASVLINAAKYPTSKLEAWRPRINDLFAVDIATGNQTGVAQVDPLPTQEITGGVVLLEPSVLGTEEGAGITVLAKDVAGTSCTSGTLSTLQVDVAQSNFRCAASRIDGLSITGGDAGGGIYVNGWAHGLEIANNRVYGNAGAFNGGVRIGIPYLELESFPLDANGNVVFRNGRIAGLGYNTDVKVHHNAITKNGTVEAPAGNGGAGGGVSICSGTDGYLVDHNWVCGNYSSSDGGGIGHIGFSQRGSITNNTILFNQSFQQTTSTHGGGLVVVGEPPVAGALSLGTGDLTIDANLIRGNFAEAGHGGGIRLQQVNGADVPASLNNQGNAVPGRWHAITLTNNVIDNNVAGYSGGGISLSDALRVTIANNTVAANDSAGIAGSVLAGGVPLPATAPGQAGVGRPSPAGISSEATSAGLLAALTSNAQRTLNAISQPLAFVNNIAWHNRSFFYSGDGRLCSSNKWADAATSPVTCTVLPEQATTGQCTGTAAYWDLGVVGDSSAAPGTLKLAPSFSVLSSTTGYTGASNSAADPSLQDLYCNGARVTPEFASVINPPGPKSLAVAATLDEGANYVSLRYGPLYLAKPLDGTPSGYAAFGDYHFAATATAGTSSALDHGTTGSSAHDVDNQARPQGAAWDIGADEFVAAAVSTDLSVTKSDGRTSAFRGSVLTYAVVVTNTGAAVTGAIVNDAVPRVLVGVTGSTTAPLSGVTWTCTASTGSSCGTASGTGAITNRLVDLLNGGTATFTVTGTVPLSARNGASLTNTATVTAPTGATDTNTANNSASDPDTVVAAGTVSFTATGLSNGVLAFGNLSGPQSRTVTVTVGATAVTFDTAAVSNVLGTAFSKGADTCSGNTVAAGGTCSIVVNFNAPANNSVRAGALTLVDSASTGPQLLGLTGS